MFKKRTHRGRRRRRGRSARTRRLRRRRRCDRAEAAAGDKPYIALVSKGFQHQFWQAVKQGAEQAAEEYERQVTFEGPTTEADVDQQIQMLQTALDKKPGRPRLRRARQPGRGPADGAGEGRRTSRSSRSTPASTATSRSRRPPPTTSPPRPRPPSTWPS